MRVCSPVMLVLYRYCKHFHLKKPLLWLGLLQRLSLLRQEGTSYLMNPLKRSVRLTTNKKGQKAQKTLVYWVSVAISSFLFLLFFKWLFPSLSPFGTFDFWKENQVWAGLKAAWPIFAWGCGITAWTAFTTLNKRSVNHDAEDILIGGIIVSTIAGVMEEIVFRWIIFLWSIIALQISNFILFGFMGFGLVELLHNYIFGAVVNFVTFGKMEWLIFDMGWAVGAAALLANAKFRSGHAYLGWFGLINSWIIGFFLFWIMFNYGLLTAIIVHFFYDLFLYLIRYIDAAIERHFGWGHPG